MNTPRTNLSILNDAEKATVEKLAAVFLYFLDTVGNAHSPRVDIEELNEAACHLTRTWMLRRKGE